ncbi:MAG: alpha/beta hydrolase family protein [Acidobacteriota bacterium]
MPAWHEGIIKSDLMRREMPYRVLPPQNYNSSVLSFSTLYLLHGLFGSFENWTTLIELESYAARHRLIIIMPEGENGWYTDGMNADDKYESYLIRELVPEIDAQFRTIANAGGRGIAGLSMGGFGAFKFALQYPSMFKFAASVSGAFEVTRWSDTSQTAAWDEFGPPISRIFGDAGSAIRQANDLKNLVNGLSEIEAAKLPFLYFDCGRDDDFIGANIRFDELLTKRGIVHRFQALAGGHDWEYWNERSKDLVEMAGELLSKPARKETGNIN